MKRYPKIYDVGLNRIGELRTARITDLRKKQTPFTTATVTVPVEDIGSFGYRQFVELFDAAGERIDIFRVTGMPSKKYAPGGMVKLTCDQALCTLQDGLIPGYHQFGGTSQNLRGAVEEVLAFQNERHWVLDRCEYDTHFEYGICDEAPFTALTMLLEPLTEPMIVTDTSAYPWKLSILKMTDEDASELRYSRNMEEITECIQNADFATRLYPRGYGEGVNQLTIRDVNGGVEYIQAPQAVRDLWGTISRPYIDTTITDAETLKAKAKAALDICQHPHISYEVSAADLSMLTGEPLDSFYTGHRVRMIYKDYGLIVRTRVTEIHIPNPLEKPGEVKLTLSSQPTSVATIIADLARKTKIRDTYGQGSTFIYADSFEQNCDKDTPAEGDIYIPANMIHVNAIMLKISRRAYRADSKGAAGGGASVSSTQAGGESTQTSSAGGTYSKSIPEQTISVGATGGPLGGEGFAAAYTEAAGSHEHSVNSHRHGIGTHSHGMAGHKHASFSSGPSPVTTAAGGSGHTEYTEGDTSAGGDHTHRFNHWHRVTGAITIPGVRIAIPAHVHEVHVPDHVHLVQLPNHEHGIVYGIYKGPMTDSVVVRVDGKVVPESAFVNGEGDIAAYLSTDDKGKIRRGVYHTLSITPVAKDGNEFGLCRIRASWNAQVFISSLTGRQY